MPKSKKSKLREANNQQIIKVMPVLQEYFVKFNELAKTVDPQIVEVNWRKVQRAKTREEAVEIAQRFIARHESPAPAIVVNGPGAEGPAGAATV